MLLLLLLLLLLLPPPPPFYGPWTVSGTAQESRYQKGKISLNPLEQEIVSGSGISWTNANLHLAPDRITMSVFYRLDALPATQPTVSKH